MRKSFLLGAVVLLSLMVSLPAVAIDRQSLASYASALNGKKKAELKTAIYNIIKEPNTLDYGNGYKRTWWGFYRTDRVESTNECINRYSSKKFYFPASYNNRRLLGMNIEHSFPKSWWGSLENVGAYMDLYNLYPSDSLANSSKSNLPMGVVTQIIEEEEGYDKVGRGTIDGVSGIKCWEPGDQYKGDFSRVYMYMATCYQDLTWKLYNDDDQTSKTYAYYQLQQDTWPTLKEWAYTLYLQWLKSDPVDELEIDRNNAVNSIQGNRNLFIDYPYLAEYVWGDSVNVAFNPYSSISTASDDDRYFAISPSGIATPTFSPEAGTFAIQQTVTISCATEGVTIYYTTDGSSPKDMETVYTGPVTIDKSCTLQAAASDGNGNWSLIAFANYTIANNSILFYESFDQCSGTGGNDGKFDNTGTATAEFKPDNAGWIVNSVYTRGGDKCARFGSGSNHGPITTPTFTVNGTSTFSFKAAPWTGDGNSLKVTVNGNDTLSINGGAPQSEISLTMKQKEWTEFVLTLTGHGQVSITFTPSMRFFLDEVMAVSESMAGDVNKDGRVDISDVTALIDIVLGKDDTEPYQYDHDAADVNDDDNIDISDVTSLIDIILGK